MSSAGEVSVMTSAGEVSINLKLILIQTKNRI